MGTYIHYTFYVYYVNIYYNYLFLRKERTEKYQDKNSMKMLIVIIYFSFLMLYLPNFVP